MGFFAKILSKNEKKDEATTFQETNFQKICLEISTIFPYAKQITRPEFSLAFAAASIIFTKDIMDRNVEDLNASINPNLNVPVRLDVATSVFCSAVTWFWLDVLIQFPQTRKNVAACFAFALGHSAELGIMLSPEELSAIDECRQGISELLREGVDERALLRVGEILCDVLNCPKNLKTASLGMLWFTDAKSILESIVDKELGS
jgi:hypothetical protein